MEGTVVIAVSPDGRVQDAETSFVQEKPAGFDVGATQERIARDALMHRIAENHCSTWLAAAITKNQTMFRCLPQALREQGWTFTTRRVEGPTPSQEVSDA